MASGALSFEEVDREVQKADLSAFRGALMAQSPGGAAAVNVCAIYKTVRPILQLVSSLPLIPQKWKDLLTIFIQILDKLCP